MMRKLAISFDPHIWVNVHSGMEASSLDLRGFYDTLTHILECYNCFQDSAFHSLGLGLCLVMAVADHTGLHSILNSIDY